MEELKNSLRGVVKELFDTDTDPSLERPDEKFGDATTNVAMVLAGDLRKNPREIAEKITGKLETLGYDAAVAGPGFINVTFSDDVMQRVIQDIHDQLEAYGRSTRYAGQKVVAEYSDPNPFKTLHAGHLYTSLVGDVVANLYEAAGAEVIRVNFGGDVGLHVGRAMWAIIRFLGGEYPEKLGEIPETERLNWISERYVEGTAAYEHDPVAKEEIIAMNKRVYALHEEGDHDSAFAQVYWTCRQWSYDGFDKLYVRLQMHPFDKYYPESETTLYGLRTVQEGREKGVFEESDGAIVYRGEKDGLHTRVFLTSEGLPTYEAKDLGLALKKWEDYHFDQSVMITGNDIVEYMKVVQAALKHFHHELPARMYHMTHGMIRLAGNQKMSSRTGNILRAQDVLDAAETANKKQTGQDSFETVLAAVKYSFLKQRIGGDIIYDPAESVSILGNSGPYLQYAHARAVSIVNQKGKVRMHDYKLEESERSLVRKLSEYPEVVDLATSELMPHHICTYLFELAQTFNRFYEKNRVIGDAREIDRLSLVSAYIQVLRNGLRLLGITAPDKM